MRAVACGVDLDCPALLYVAYPGREKRLTCPVRCDQPSVWKLVLPVSLGASYDTVQQYSD